MRETGPDEPNPHISRIVVIGVGGGGSNAVDTMLASDLTGIDFVTINTDAQALHKSKAPTKLQIGAQLTRGLGAGSNPEVGREAALADRERLSELFTGADLVFVTAGFGGGTGTGAAPVIAEIARESGALTVAFATLPFQFEGKRRLRLALEGVGHLAERVDTLVTVPNERLLAIVDESTSMSDAFRAVDNVLVAGVRGLVDVIHASGRVNVDFADVRTVMAGRGTALLGVGSGKGPHRTLEAAQAAFSSPLMAHTSLAGARHILLSFTSPPDLTLYEINAASCLVQEEADEDVNLIWGWSVDERLKDEVRVTLIATGFEDEHSTRTRQARRRHVPRPPEPLAADRDRPAAPVGIPDPDTDEYDIPSFFHHSD